MTNIEWTDETWNPIAGCNDVSEGCRHCYARTMAGRLEAMGVAKYAGLTVLQGSHRVWTGKISFDEKALLAPLRRKKPTRYFVNSMSDLFHPNVTDAQIDRVFAVMALCPQHTFQVLTKRPGRMLAYLTNEEVQNRWCVAGNPFVVESAIPLEKYADRAMFRDDDGVFRSVFSQWPLPNVWLGVSVEDQKTADGRIPLLLQTPAAVRFISAEPLLGPIDFYAVDIERPKWREEYGLCEDVYLKWVIVGGESGPGARPMHPEWARGLRDQCVAAGLPFFFKQWGGVYVGAMPWCGGAAGSSETGPVRYFRN